MIRTRVLIQRSISPDGKAVAQAKSVVTTSSSNNPSNSNESSNNDALDDQLNSSAHVVEQTAEVHTSANGSYSYSYSASHCSKS